MDDGLTASKASSSHIPTILIGINQANHDAIDDNIQANHYVGVPVKSDARCGYKELDFHD